MKLGYDIFRKLDDGSPVWVAQANSLVAARKVLKSLQLSSPGDYFLRDAETGKVISDPSPET
jgi:hypothetical protein